MENLVCSICGDAIDISEGFSISCFNQNKKCKRCSGRDSSHLYSRLPIIPSQRFRYSPVGSDTIYENCYYLISRYLQSGNISIEVRSEDHNLLGRLTANIKYKVPEDYIAINNYSFDNKISNFLVEEGIIVDQPITCILTDSCYFVPVYRITEAGKFLMELL